MKQCVLKASSWILKDKIYAELMATIVVKRTVYWGSAHHCIVGFSLDRSTAIVYFIILCIWSEGTLVHFSI